MATKKKTSKATGSKKTAIKKNNKIVAAKKTNLKVVGGQEKAVKAAAAVLSNRSNDATDSGVKVTQKSVKKITKTVAKKASPATKATAKKSPKVEVSQNIDDASKVINDAITKNQEQFETLITCSNKGSEASREIGEEIAETTSKWLDKQIEVSKELMECRTFNDLFELQSRVVSESMGNLFDESTRISEIIVSYATEASEPFQKSFAEATENLSKTFNA